MRFLCKCLKYVHPYRAHVPQRMPGDWKKGDPLSSFTLRASALSAEWYSPVPAPSCDPLARRNPVRTRANASGTHPGLPQTSQILKIKAEIKCNAASLITYSNIFIHLCNRVMSEALPTEGLHFLLFFHLCQCTLLHLSNNHIGYYMYINNS